VNPVAAGFENDQFVSATSLAEFGHVGAGGDADGFLVNESAALRLCRGERDCREDRYSDKSESEVHIVLIIGCKDAACKVSAWADAF